VTSLRRPSLFLYPLHYVFHFLYQHTVDSADFEFGGIFIIVYTFDFLLCIFISVMVYFHLCV
jgi:hypothetical protein